MGLTLWIVPPRPDSGRLKVAMQPPHAGDDQLDPSFPQFEPHITLASIPLDTPIVRLRESIPPDQRRLKVSFASVEVGTHYFRSVYIAVKLSPELAKLHQEVHATLGMDPITPAYPHISLCYVTDEDAEKGSRQRFFEGLGIRNKGEDIALNCGAGEKEDWMEGFLAGDIWIVRCEGPVETWEVLDVIELHNA